MDADAKLLTQDADVDVDAEITSSGSLFFFAAAAVGDITDAITDADADVAWITAASGSFSFSAAAAAGAETAAAASAANSKRAGDSPPFFFVKSTRRVSFSGHFPVFSYPVSSESSGPSASRFQICFSHTPRQFRKHCSHL